VRSLAGALQVEKDPGVANGMIAALAAAGPRAEERSAALTQMCAALVKQAEAFAAGQTAGDPVAWAEAFQRGVKAAQGALLDQAKVGALDAALAKETARMSAQALAHVVRRLESFKSDGNHEAEQAALGELARAAEGTLIFIDVNLAKRPAQAQKIDAAFPDAAKVRAEAARWAGAQGILTQAPYGFEPALK
jgi:hypothetical protein